MAENTAVYEGLFILDANKFARERDNLAREVEALVEAVDGELLVSRLWEERRLAYVGITRARERLYLLNAWSRSLWGGLNYNPASRFLAEIPNELVHQADQRKKAGKSRSAGATHDPTVFKVGQEVEHSRWGRGTIVEIARSNFGLEATVHFPAVGEKRLDLSMAPLKPIG